MPVEEAFGERISCLRQTSQLRGKRSSKGTFELSLSLQQVRSPDQI